MRIILISWLIALLLIFPISAKNLYVNGSTGDDATTYANNSSSTPWATVGRAVWGSDTRSDVDVDNDTPPTSSEAAQAGDTVFVVAGTYHTTQGTAGTPNWDEVLYNTANEGTSGNPIVIQAVGTVTLTSSNNGQPVFGSRLRDYVEWRGFTLSYANNTLPTYERGVAVIVASTGNKIEYCTITGDPNITAGPGNNTNCIYIHTSINCTVAHNDLTGTGGISGENNSAITLYNSHNIDIHNNEFTVVNSGIYAKAPQSGNRQTNINIYRNIFSGGSEEAIRFLTNADSLDGSLVSGDVYENLIYGANIGIALTPISEEWRDIDSLQIYNNTITGCTYGVWIGNGGIFYKVTFRDNLLHNLTNAYWDYDNSNVNATFLSQFLPDYNYYIDISGDFYLANSSYAGLSDWQSALTGTSQEDNSPDSTSSSGSATFKDADYRITDGHPALTASSVSGEIGCYVNVDTLGIDGSLPGGSEPPATPSITTSINYKERP